MTILLPCQKKDNRSDLVFDIESDGFLPTVTTIHCIGLCDLNNLKTRVYYGKEIEDAIIQLANARTIIGHNIIDYDLKVINKLFPELYSNFTSNPLDTLVWSRLLHPDRQGGHSLKAWGKRLGFEKGSLEDDEDEGEESESIWAQLTEEMLVYCDRDVGLTVKVLNALRKEADYPDNFLDSWYSFKTLMEIPCQ